MTKLKVMTIFGTRPEAIKMAPLHRALSTCPDIEALCAVTAQHREMLDQVLSLFSITPDHDLNIMEPGQSLATITTKALSGLDALFSREKPDLVLVHGDTSTTFAGALAAFYHKIPVGHVEAGLRTGDKYAPFPEETNRTMVGRLADLHFCPTGTNRENLVREGIQNGLFVTGNTVIDALRLTVAPDYAFSTPLLQSLPFDRERIILVTAHRRENWGQPFSQILDALCHLLDTFPDVRIVLPVHPNPAVSDMIHDRLGAHPRADLFPPLPVHEMHNLMARCHLVLTDSGGLQEEAPALGKPVLVLRRETERPEAVTAGTVKLAGVDAGVIFSMTSELLTDPAAYSAMAQAVNPYGDGHASRRIVQAILWHFGRSPDKPEEFRAL